MASLENRIPDPETADRVVIAVSFYNDGEILVYLCRRKGDASMDGLGMVGSSVMGS